MLQKHLQALALIPQQHIEPNRMQGKMNNYFIKIKEMPLIKQTEFSEVNPVGNGLPLTFYNAALL